MKRQAARQAGEQAGWQTGRQVGRWKPEVGMVIACTECVYIYSSAAAFYGISGRLLLMPPPFPYLFFAIRLSHTAAQ
jgi:hypothetical protein